MKQTKKKWNEEFYIPIFQKTFQYLHPGGYYCINVPHEIYENILIPLFGEAIRLIEYTKRKRKDYAVEYIYVWQKV